MLTAKTPTAVREPVKEPRMSIAPAQSVAKTSRLPNSGERASTVRRRLPFGGLWLAACLLLAGWLGFGALNSPPPADELASPLPAASMADVASVEQSPPARAIEEIEVGQRVIGHNPIREQADVLEIESATWRRIGLRMRKESGHSLWVELLRPQAWIRATDAKPGQTVKMNLPEMGAIGDAEVTRIRPCPEIESGEGTIVTGTFRHQIHGSSEVVHLRLEGQREAIGVTSNHAYWSVNRQEFVAVGDLSVGELVDSVYGPRHVVSIRPITYTGFVYNLETAEHVYRVGTLGTLVHNVCAKKLRDAMKEAGMFGDPGTVPHHIVSRFAGDADRARAILAKHKIGLDSHWNGVFLPTRPSTARRSGSVGGARGAIHDNLHTGDYYTQVTDRLVDADSRAGRPAVLRELQKIRRELLDGTFATLMNRNINF